MTKHRSLSHSARESYLLCPRKFAFQYEMRLEPIEGKSSLRMGKAFSLALEHRDPARTSEGYWEGVPLHERVMDHQATLEIAQVELLSDMYLERYPDDNKPGRIWTPEFEFRSKGLGRGFLDAIIEEVDGERERTCAVHGEVRGAAERVLDLDGGDELGGLRDIRAERGLGPGSSPELHAPPRGDRAGAGAGSPVPHAPVCEPGSPGAGDAGRELPEGGVAPGGEDALSEGPRVHAGEHVRAQGEAPLSNVQAGLGPRCSCRKTIGVENKLLGAFWWNDAARKTLAIDLQVSAYFAALRELGKPLDHMLYRVTKKPTIKQDSRKKETLSEYLLRLRDRIENDPGATFEEHVLYRTDAELDRFMEQAADVNAHVRLSRRSGAWPQSTKACTMFGGCSFLPICRGEVGATDEFRIKPEPVKFKMPRLGKVQKAVLLALDDAFTSPVALSALAKRVAYSQPSVASALKSLAERGYICDDGVIEGETYWDVMPDAEPILQRLRPTPSA